MSIFLTFLCALSPCVQSIHSPHYSSNNNKTQSLMPVCKQCLPPKKTHQVTVTSLPLPMHHVIPKIQVTNMCPHEVIICSIISLCVDHSHNDDIRNDLEELQELSACLVNSNNN